MLTGVQKAMLENHITWAFEEWRSLVLLGAKCQSQQDKTLLDERAATLYGDMVLTKGLLLADRDTTPRPGMPSEEDSDRATEWVDDFVKRKFDERLGEAD
jgi:hypothetical protein